MAMQRPAQRWRVTLAGLLAVPVAAVLVLAACGTDSNGGSSSGGTTIQIWEG